jgi:hypothetical protein
MGDELARRHVEARTRAVQEPALAGLVVSVMKRRPVAVVMLVPLWMSVVSVSREVDDSGQGGTLRSMFVEQGYQIERW